MRTPNLPPLIFLIVFFATQSTYAQGFTVIGEVAGLESPALMLENSDIRIVGTSPEFDDVTVHGSESDAILKDYLVKDQELADQMAERVLLLKESVNRHRTSIVGALLPIFCTLGDVLTSEDYILMHESLSEDMQQSGYGQMVLQRSKK